MERTPRSSRTRMLDDNSLGILSMDNLKVFGDKSSMCNWSKNSSAMTGKSVSNRLYEGRLKALEILEQQPRRSHFNKSSAKNYIDRNSTAIDGQENVMPQQTVNSINISDLITDDTINLNGSGSSIASIAPSSVSAGGVTRDLKISFEPSEITGRSTLYKNETKQVGKQEILNNKCESNTGGRVSLSVPEILASSFAERARQLTNKVQQPPEGKRLSSIVNDSSTLGSLNKIQSLPRTADMSCTYLSLNSGGDGFSFSFAASDRQQLFDQGNFSAEFAPGELMKSKLALDEVSWANEYAAVPTATLSTEAKEKVKEGMQKQQNNVNSDIDTSVSNSVLMGDPDFSVGNFFKTRSDNIWQIAGTKSPNKFRTPSALVEDSEVNLAPNVPKGVSTASSALTTPKIDNKTYTRLLNSKLTTKSKQVELKNPENIKDKSYLLSLTAIDRALRNLDTDASTGELVNKLIVHGQKQHINQNDFEEYYAENKENEPTIIDGSRQQHTDTMSFSESVLNSTDFKQLQQSITEPRTPLSPLLDVSQKIPAIKVVSSIATVDLENDADIDEWPTTPVKSPHRRVCRKKSPHPVISPDSGKNSNFTDDEEKTPVNRKSNAANIVQDLTAATSAKRLPKSLCSTRLDGCEAVTPTSADCEFGISPNVSKNASNQTLTNGNCRNIISPLSSPCSALSSPLLDSTTNSERRFLLPGAARKTVASPVSSESGSTCSSGAVRKATGVRSTSRCSNSSEFSHRDGKCLPLKVTRVELCWGSTKLRTDLRKSMQVKNISEKRLVVRIGIHGPGFQLINTDSNILTMQSQECRSIVINFCPTVCGAAVGVLSFYSPLACSNANLSLMDIPLYGYGGNANISIQGLLKGPVGSSFLPMGDVSELPEGTLQSSISIYNKGPLTAFASISVDSNGLLKPRLSDAFEIKPNVAIIPPCSGISVEIFFRPSREHIKSIKKNSQVVTLATMRIICGDEPNRQRMRGLLQRMTSNDRKQLSSATLDNLWSKFPAERELRELSSLKEAPEVLLDLATFIKIHEVALTLNCDFDESTESTLLFPQADETVLFRTVCVANSPTPTQSNILDPVDELLEADTTSLDQPASEDGSWSVKPTSIEFNVMNEKNNTSSIFITNSYKSRQYFEISCNVPQLLRFHPSDGYVSPDGSQLEIVARIVQDRMREIATLNKDVIVVVRMENERVSVPVKFNI